MNRSILLIVLLLINISCFSQKTEWPTKDWATTTMSKVKMNEEPINRFVDEIKQGKYGFIDYVLIIKDGKKVLDIPFKNDYIKISSGKKNSLGCGYKACSVADSLNEFNYLHPYTHPYYKNKLIHTLQSNTKSVTSILIGQLIQQKKITGTSAPILSFFEEYDLSRTPAELKNSTLADLLTMRSGIEWHEMDRPMGPTNTTYELEHSPDWIQFTLNQPMDSKPGEKWSYNSGGSQLMAGIIKKTSGLHADEFARENLFKPLGITEYYWKKTPTGHPDTEGGLYLSATDLAKIGYLYLNKGWWKDKMIVDSAWVNQSIKRHAAVGNQGWGYGYQWWRVDEDNAEIWACIGFGGNYMFVFPEYGIVAVAHAWNVFDNPKASFNRPFVQAILKAVDHKP